MRHLWIVALFLSGCMNQEFHLGESQNVVQSLPLTKQKQRIAILQKKLEYAQRNLKTATEEVEQLSSEIQQSQLTMIEKQLEIGSKNSFLKEREILQQIVENGPSPEAFEARVVLDRMLRIKG
jgi:putative cell wall-binding protein